MFYYNLDGNFSSDETGNQIAAGGELLTGIQNAYWSLTQYDPDIAWSGRFDNGATVPVFKTFEYSAWVVRSGDIDPTGIPEPASLLLFGLGMLGLGWARSRKS